MRAERLARGESLREAAQRMGITPARLCDIEAGRAALAPAEKPGSDGEGR